jgi:outer membrane protein assembly factor BamB
MKTRALLLLAASLAAVAANAEDWPQFRGPNRDGVSKETGLLKKWPQGGPKLVWTWKEAGTGYSGPAIVGDRLYMCGARGEDDMVYALDLSQNPPKELWATRIGPKYAEKKNQWNEGPIVTPTVDADLVFALGGAGDLVCIETKSGKEKWRRSLLKDLNGQVYNFNGGGPDEQLGWGFACAPLVDGDKVICVPGGKDGTLAALSKANGDVLWRSKDVTDVATYASPVAATIGGTKQYLQMTNQGVVAVDGNGKVAWYYKREKPYEDIIGSSPLINGDFVFISAAGPGGGNDLIQIKKADGQFTATKVYGKKDLANYHGGMVLVGDHVYGASGDLGRSRWLCVDFKTGKVAWNVDLGGKGSITAADGSLYCLLEKNGLVVHSPASPTQKLTADESFELPEASKLRKPSGGVWTHPVIANGKMYLRDQELLFCYEVK